MAGRFRRAGPAGGAVDRGMGTVAPRVPQRLADKAPGAPGLGAAILDRLGIDEGTPLEISTNGQVIVISPVRRGRRPARLKAIVAEAHREYGGVFRRLAEP